MSAIEKAREWCGQTYDAGSYISGEAYGIMKALLAEVERMKAALAAAQSLRAEAEGEVERLRRLLSESVRLIEDSKELSAIEDAYEQGRESMREEAAYLARTFSIHGVGSLRVAMCESIRQIPTKEPR